MQIGEKMGLTAKENGESKQRILPETGIHLARCIQVIDLGTVYNEMYEKNVHKIRIAWELPNLEHVFDESKGSQSFIVGKEYTLSLAEKANLRKDLAGWRSRDFTEKELAGFDVFDVLGHPCMVNLIHKTSAKGKQYEYVDAVTPPMKGLQIPDQKNSSLTLSFEDAEKDLDTFNHSMGLLPNFLQDRIKESKEWDILMANIGAEAEKPASDDDTMPF